MSFVLEARNTADETRTLPAGLTRSAVPALLRRLWRQDSTHDRVVLTALGKITGDRSFRSLQSWDVPEERLRTIAVLESWYHGE